MSHRNTAEFRLKGGPKPGATVMLGRYDTSPVLTFIPAPALVFTDLTLPSGTGLGPRLMTPRVEHA
jgi:hypothetical protein